MIADDDFMVKVIVVEGLLKIFPENAACGLS